MLFRAHFAVRCVSSPLILMQHGSINAPIAAQNYRLQQTQKCFLAIIAREVKNDGEVVHAFYGIITPGANDYAEQNLHDSQSSQKLAFFHFVKPAMVFHRRLCYRD